MNFMSHSTQNKVSPRGRKNDIPPIILTTSSGCTLTSMFNFLLMFYGNHRIKLHNCRARQTDIRICQSSATPSIGQLHSLTYGPPQDWKRPPGRPGQRGCRQSNQTTSLQWILVCSLLADELKTTVHGGNLWRQPCSWPMHARYHNDDRQMDGSQHAFCKEIWSVYFFYFVNLTA